MSEENSNGKHVAGTQDEPSVALETVRQLTISPLITGFLQGFVSVGRQKWRERRARREQEAREKAAAEAAGSAQRELEVLQEIGKAS